MTHPHDTPPTPDALAQILTPEERRCVERWRRDDSRAEAYLLPIIERLAGEVARLREERNMASGVVTKIAKLRKQLARKSAR